MLLWLRKYWKPVVTFSLLLAVLGVTNFLIYSSYTEDYKHQQSFREKYGIFSIDVPANLEFAGESVPLNEFDVYERMDRELLVNTYFQSQTLLMHKRANRWFPVIEPILRKNDIPEDFKYLPLVETNFIHSVSPRGAAGFWQFMEITAKEYGLEVNEEIDERYNVEKSTVAACRYIKDLKEKLGSWTMAAAAYNMGLSAAKTQMQRQRAANYYDLLLNYETARYVFRILATKEIINHPEKYGYHFRQKDLYYQIPTYSVKLDTAVTDFAVFAEKLNINYKTLKTFNPWLREAFLTNQEAKTYYLEIPKEGYTHLSPYRHEEKPDSVSTGNPDKK